MQTKTIKTMNALLPNTFKLTHLGVLLLCSCSVVANENGDDKLSSWYYGSTVEVTAEPDVSDIGNELTNTGVSLSTIGVDDSRVGWKLNVGFDLTRNIAIEAGYRELNDSSPVLNTLVSDPERFFNRSQKVNPTSTDGFTLGSVYHYNITDNIGLMGSVGVFNWAGELDSQALNGQQSVANDENKGTDLYFGLGGGYQLTDDVTLMIEWERYKLDDDNAQMWSIGVNYHFK